MKDTHIERAAPGRIPVLSPTLHCVAMTALVYLRSSFGHTMLRPKSVFFAFSWAFTLFCVFAWKEPGIWPQYRAVCLFGAGSIILYWLHLAISVSRELYRKGEHDYYSGTSHALRFLRRPGFENATAEQNIHLWLEPGVVLIVSAMLRFVAGERHLSSWLVIVAACMFLKEGTNYWFTVRKDKIKSDMGLDAEEQGESLPDGRSDHEAPKPTRKESVKRARNAALAEENARERRFAELLRLRPPFTLEQAEENYRTLIRLEHPDATEEPSGSNERSAELNDAVKFFRTRLRQ